MASVFSLLHFFQLQKVNIPEHEFEMLLMTAIPQLAKDSARWKRSRSFSANSITLALKSFSRHLNPT